MQFLALHGCLVTAFIFQGIVSLGFFLETK
jgi:hypothetical protein